MGSLNRTNPINFPSFGWATSCKMKRIKSPSENNIFPLAGTARSLSHRHLVYSCYATGIDREKMTVGGGDGTRRRTLRCVYCDLNVDHSLIIDLDI